MANREKIAIGEYYHIYNRGVDKRLVTTGDTDSNRFMQSIEFFNSKEPVMGLREAILNKKDGFCDPLVEIVCYCLNPNHFHLLLKEIIEGGISEFMKRLGGGYTWYFNSKYKRSGALFQGVFKSELIKSNEQLLHASVYVNLNNRIHKISGETAGRVRSSWNEYMKKSSKNICTKKVILEQFRSIKDYKHFAKSSLGEILKAKENGKDPEMLIGKHFF